MDKIAELITDLQEIFDGYQTISITATDNSGTYVTAYKVKMVNELPKLDEQKNVWITHEGEVKVL